MNRDVDKRILLIACQSKFTETMRRLRSQETTNGRRVPIIALTALTTNADRQTCIEAGADDYVTKPFSAEALLTIIHRHMPGLCEACVKVMTTALRDSKHCVQAFREGCESYVTKPLKEAELLARMRELGLLANQPTTP